MSLYGFSNSGFNNTLSGVLSITDGLGTEIVNGNITTNNIDGNNISLDGSISSVGGNTINEFSNSISITSSTANLDISQSQGIKATSSLTISPTELSYLDGCTSNIQNQIDSLPTPPDITVYPGWGCVFYADANYTGTVLLNYNNNTKNPVCVNLSSSNAASSVRIYYQNQELGSL